MEMFEILLGILYASAIFVTPLAVDEWERTIDPSWMCFLTPLASWFSAFSLTLWWVL